MRKKKFKSICFFQQHLRVFNIWTIIHFALDEAEIWKAEPPADGLRPPSISPRRWKTGRGPEAGQTKVSQSLESVLLHYSWEHQHKRDFWELTTYHSPPKATGTREMEGLQSLGEGWRELNTWLDQNRQERRWLLAVSLELNIIIIFENSRKKI